MGGVERRLSSFDLCRLLVGTGNVQWGGFCMGLSAVELALVLLAFRRPRRWVFIAGSCEQLYLLITFMLRPSSEALTEPWLFTFLSYVSWAMCLTGFFVKPPRTGVAARPEIAPSRIDEQTMRRSVIMRKLISSGSPYEPKVGISRAVRVGNVIAVSGTAPIGADGRTVGIGDAGAQARRCLEIIAAALDKAGASLRDVVRTRTLLVRIEDWEAVAAVHGEFFSEIRPANTIVQISRFIDPDWLVELEADAVVDDGQTAR